MFANPPGKLLLQNCCATLTGATLSYRKLKVFIYTYINAQSIFYNYYAQSILIVNFYTVAEVQLLKLYKLHMSFRALKRLCYNFVINLI